MEGVFCMKRKRVLVHVDVFWQWVWQFPAVNARAAVYSSIQLSVTKPNLQAGDGLFDYCSDEVKEFAEEF